MKRIIAPIIITAIVLTFLGFQTFAALKYISFGLNIPLFSYIIIIGLICLSGAFIAVLIQRIKEIKKEEKEDDLSKY